MCRQSMSMFDSPSFDPILFFEHDTKNMEIHNKVNINLPCFII